MLIIFGPSGSVLDGSVPIKVSIWEVFGQVIIVEFGNSLDEPILGELWILNQVGSELTFGFHSEIERDCSEAFELGGGFEEHG